MGTELSAALASTGIVHFGQSLGSQERFKHRAWIGVRVDALLQNFWRERPSDAVMDMALADWVEALEEFRPDEITAACREYLSRTSPPKPKPGDIRAICLQGRAALLRSLPKPVVDDAPRLSPPDVEERRQVARQILREVGLRLKTSGEA